MDAPVDATGQIPQHPAVCGAEEQVPGLGLLPRAFDVLQDPGDLRPGEVGRQGKPDDRLEALDPAVRREAVDDLLRAGVLPDDGVVHRLSGGPVPDDGGLALVGDPDGGDVVPGQVGSGQGEADDLLHVAPDLPRVML
ncbi:hypothetical protein ABE10_03285, partial [Bacillus toyonensis]|nr:hypothetical protein [Bacillus toyonensis]